MKQFTMSMYANKEDLYKAKSEYLASQLEEAKKALKEIDAYLWHNDQHAYDINQTRKVIKAALAKLGE